jgi:hypothetical protein
LVLLQTHRQTLQVAQARGQRGAQLGTTQVALYLVGSQDEKVGEFYFVTSLGCGVNRLDLEIGGRFLGGLEPEPPDEAGSFCACFSNFKMGSRMWGFPKTPSCARVF